MNSTQPPDLNIARQNMNNKTETQKPLLIHGAKFKVIITLDAELVTDTDGVTKDQLCDLMLRDDAYGLKSIVVGKVNPESKGDHDTEIIWNSETVEVV